jgi:hypothetical protein
MVLFSLLSTVSLKNDTQFSFLKQMGWTIKRRHKCLWYLKIHFVTTEIKKKSWIQVKTNNITDTKLNTDWVYASVKYLSCVNIKYDALGFNRKSSNITLSQSLYVQPLWVPTSANQNLSPAVRANYNFTTTQSDIWEKTVSSDRQNCRVVIHSYTDIVKL